MADTRENALAGAFWRCSGCGTPNPSASYVTNCLGCGAARPINPEPAGPPPGARVMIRPVRGRYVLFASWAYAAVVFAALGLIHGVGDTWWPVILLLFMPRWVFLGPIALLAVVSGLRRCPAHWVLQGAIATVIAGPLMGASLAVHRLWEQPPGGAVVRIATFNMGLQPIRTGDLKRWIAARGLDVVCFQEGGTDRLRLLPELPEGWTLSPRAYLATRLPVVAELKPLPHDSPPGRYYSAIMERQRLRTRSGREFVVASVHLPTLREGIEEFLWRRESDGLRRQTTWWGHEMARILTAMAESSDVPVVVAGDFNMPSDDSTMAALRTSFRFAFEDGGMGYGYTRPVRLPWVRIDHILTGPQWYVADCRVGPDFGSDHLPLYARLVLTDEAPVKPAR